MLTWLGYLAISFVLTSMLSQMFPDGRFTLATLALVTLVGSAGALIGAEYFRTVVFSSPLLGAGISTALLLLFLDRTGLLVEDPDEEG